MPEWVISLIVSWLPLILWLGSVWWLIRTIKKCLTTKDGRSITTVVEELSSHIKRSNPAP